MTEAQLTTLILYLTWVGLPLIFCLFGVFVKALSGDHPPMWLRTVSRWALIFVFSAVVSMAFDRFALPQEEIRSEILKYLGSLLLARIIIFPLSAFVFYVLVTLVSFFKEPEGNFRFRREVGGNFSWGMVLGFGMMILACVYGNSPVEENDSPRNAQRTSALPNIAPNLKPTAARPVSQPQESSGVSRIVDPVMREFGELERSILATLGNFKNDLERKQSEEAVVNEGLNLPNYKKFRDLVVDVAKRRGVEPELALAIIAVESHFNENFQANDGGRGLMNVTANMARQVGMADFMSPGSNVEVGCGVLKAQIDYFGEGKIERAIAAYHFGTERVNKDPDIIKSDETVRRYVENVLQIRDKLRAQ